MFNWFTRWFDRRVKEAWDRAREEVNIIQIDDHRGMIGATTKGLQRDSAINFSLHHAENGWIVEIRHYDHKTDRHYTKMHLIGDNEDFDQSICHIITMTALRG